MTSSVLAASGGEAACEAAAIVEAVGDLDDSVSSDGSQIMAVSTDELEDEAEFFGIL
jgi:hypothetical protein